jgi:hypothetical protein
MRGVTISSMVLLLLAALVSGPCAACFAAPHSCSTPCGHCQKSGKCAAPAVDLNHLQKVHSGAGFSLEPSGAIAGPIAAPAASRSAITVAAPYSPPDLYLRNSVLNI